MRNRRLWWVMFAGILAIVIGVILVTLASLATAKDVRLQVVLQVACFQSPAKPPNCTAWAVSVFQQHYPELKNCDKLEGEAMLNCLAKQGIKPDG